MGPITHYIKWTPRWTQSSAFVNRKTLDVSDHVVSLNLRSNIAKPTDGNITFEASGAFFLLILLLF